MDMINAASLWELTQLHSAQCSLPRCCVRDNRAISYFHCPKTQIQPHYFVFSNRPPEPEPPAPFHHGVVINIVRGFSRHAYTYPLAYVTTTADKYDISVTATCECEQPGMHLCLLDAACCEYNKL